MRTIRRLIALLVVLLVALGVYVGVGAARQHAHEQAEISLRESVLNAAKQCCAVEGSYPASLAYLEDAYGLTINHDDYVVSYEWFADNVLPSVVVTAR